jgi:hypothetical protein
MTQLLESVFGCCCCCCCRCCCRNDETFPRLADPLGYVDKDDIFHAVKAIVAAQRDYGRRDDRKQARLKYLVQEWGIDKFRWGPGGLCYMVWHNTS